MPSHDHRSKFEPGSAALERLAKRGYAIVLHPGQQRVRLFQWYGARLEVLEESDRQARIVIDRTVN